MGQERSSTPLNRGALGSDLPATLEAAGFRLRLLTEGDAPELVAAVERARPSLARWTAWSPHVLDAAAMRRYLRGWSARPQYGIEVEGRLVGMLGVYGTQTPEEPWLDLGYWIEPAVVGRGVATRAVRALASAADREILLAIHPDNEKSLAVARRLGLVETDDERTWQGERLLVFRGRPDPFAALDAPAPFLRRMARKDASELYATIERARPSLEPWMPWARESTLETSRAILATDGGRNWAILHEGRIAGALGVNALARGEAEFGYWLEPAACGRGLVTRGVQALFAAGAAEGVFSSFFLLIAEGNAASEAVARRLDLSPGETVSRDGRPLREWRRR